MTHDDLMKRLDVLVSRLSHYGLVSRWASVVAAVALLLSIAALAVAIFYSHSHPGAPT